MSILWPVLREKGTGMGMASVPFSRELQTFPLQLETGGNDDVSTVLVDAQQTSPWFFGCGRREELAHKAAEQR